MTAVVERPGSSLITHLTKTHPPRTSHTPYVPPKFLAFSTELIYLCLRFVAYLAGFHPSFPGLVAVNSTNPDLSAPETLAEYKKDGTPSSSFAS